MRVSGQSHSPVDVPPEIFQYPLNRRLGWPQNRSALVREKSPPPGFDHRTVQPVESSYTTYAIPAHLVGRVDAWIDKYYVSRKIQEIQTLKEECECKLCAPSRGAYDLSNVF
jgi:hypothetical protein